MSWEIGVSAIIVGATWYFTWQSFELDKEHVLLKLLFSIGSFIMMIGGLNYALQLTIDKTSTSEIVNAVTTVYIVGMWMFYLFMAYIVLYYIVVLFRWMNDTFLGGGKFK